MLCNTDFQFPRILCFWGHFHVCILFNDIYIDVYWGKPQLLWLECYYDIIGKTQNAIFNIIPYYLYIGSSIFEVWSSDFNVQRQGLAPTLEPTYR